MGLRSAEWVGGFPCRGQEAPQRALAKLSNNEWRPSRCPQLSFAKMVSSSPVSQSGSSSEARVLYGRIALHVTRALNALSTVENEPECGAYVRRTAVAHRRAGRELTRPSVRNGDGDRRLPESR
jgi:hypothetical protein